MRKYISAAALTFLLAATPVFAQTTDVQAQIAALQAQIQQLLQIIANLNGGGTTPAQQCIDLKYNFGPDDTDNETGGEVSKLQGFLVSQGLLRAELPRSYFGLATMKALQQWQKQKGIVSSGDPDSTGFGFVGKKTRLALACSSTMLPPPRPDATLGASPASGPAPLTVFFQASGSNLDAGAYIDFGDGSNNGAGLTGSRTYNDVGTYRATLHKNGAKGEVVASALITVTTAGSAACSFRPYAVETYGSGRISFGERPQTVESCKEMCTISRNEKYGLNYSGVCTYTNPAGQQLPIIIPAGTNTAESQLTPTIELLAPSTGFTVSRKGKMTISWKATTDKRRIVTGNISLLSTSNTGNARPVGSVAGSGFMKTVEPGTQYDTFVQDWGLNDSVPGTYSVTLSLRDCSPKGCDQNPDFPAPGYGPVQTYATSHTVTFTVVDDESTAPLSIDWRNKSFLLGNYKQALAQTVCNAAPIGPGAVCRWGQQILTQQGIKDGGSYIHVTKPFPNEYLQKSNPVYSMEFLDPSGQPGDNYTVYFKSFTSTSGSEVADIVERTLSGVTKQSNGITSGSFYLGDLPAGDYYLDILNTMTGNRGGVGAYVFVR